MSGAEILMDRPHGGWGDLVTNHTLDLRFAVSEARFDRKLEGRESRLEAKVNALESSMELQFAVVDARFDQLEDRLLTIVAVGGVIVAAIRI